MTIALTSRGDRIISEQFCHNTNPSSLFQDYFPSSVKKNILGLTISISLCITLGNYLIHVIYHLLEISRNLCISSHRLQANTTTGTLIGEYT